MAKAFGGMGGGMAGLATRPMPRPVGLGGVQTEQAPRRGMMGQMTPERYDMAMQMLQAAMSGAAGSGSPALAFLTPIIGAMTGAKLADKRDAAVSAEQDAMATGLLGENISPQMRQAMDVLNNPDSPAYLKQIAGSMLKGGVPIGGGAQPRRSSGGGSRSGRSGSGGPPRPQKLTYITKDPDGVYRGYNAATGKREVVPNADVKATPASLPAPPVTPTPPAGPTVNPAATPSAMPARAPAVLLPPTPLSDDELLNQY
jgi:hypothetical protein